jgi:hypothetical protein
MCVGGGRPAERNNRRVGLQECADIGPNTDREGLDLVTGRLRQKADRLDKQRGNGLSFLNVWRPGKDLASAPPSIVLSSLVP